MLQVADLQYASPATVSRCGMVYVDPKNLRYTPYWQRWVNNRPGKVLKKTYIQCDDWTCLLFDNISTLFCFLGTRSAQQIIRKICTKLD